MKRKSILLTTIGIILVAIGLLINFIITSTNERKNNSRIKNQISSNYKLIEDNMQIINGEREIILNISNEYSSENIEYNYTNWINSFNEYLKSINRLNEYKEFIKEVCVNKEYKDSNYNSKCKSIINSYETAINYFVKDVNSFNKYIDEYNQNVSDENKKNNFITNYDYIDINDDGKLLGK